MRRNSLCVLAVLLVAGLNGLPVSAQTGLTAQIGKQLDATQEAIADHLSTNASAPIVNGTLTRDRRVIEGAAPVILRTFQQAGYSEQDAIVGLAWTWYGVRLGPKALPLTTGLSGHAVQAKAADLGKLIVHSKPSGAAIFVDTTQWPHPTDQIGFADVGQRQVRVSMEGLEPAEATCSVSRIRTATFSAELLPQGSKAYCK